MLENKSNKKIIFNDIKIKMLNLITTIKKLINDFNLDIKRGEKYVLLRKCLGKSTILDLILGFRIPKSGSIFLNGNLISEDLENESLKSITSYVLKKYFY